MGNACGATKKIKNNKNSASNSEEAKDNDKKPKGELEITFNKINLKQKNDQENISKKDSVNSSKEISINNQNDRTTDVKFTNSIIETHHIDDTNKDDLASTFKKVKLKENTGLENPSNIKFKNTSKITPLKVEINNNNTPSKSDIATVFNDKPIINEKSENNRPIQAGLFNSQIETPLLQENVEIIETPLLTENVEIIETPLLTENVENVQIKKISSTNTLEKEQKCEENYDNDQLDLSIIIPQKILKETDIVELNNSFNTNTNNNEKVYYWQNKNIIIKENGNDFPLIIQDNYIEEISNNMINKNKDVVNEENKMNSVKPQIIKKDNTKQNIIEYQQTYQDNGKDISNKIDVELIDSLTELEFINNNELKTLQKFSQNSNFENQFLQKINNIFSDFDNHQTELSDKQQSKKSTQRQITFKKILNGQNQLKFKYDKFYRQPRIDLPVKSQSQFKPKKIEELEEDQADSKNKIDEFIDDQDELEMLTYLDIKYKYDDRIEIKIKFELIDDDMKEITTIDHSGKINNQNRINKCQSKNLSYIESFDKQQNQSISDMNLCYGNNESWQECSQLVSQSNQDVIKEDRFLPWQNVRQNKRKNNKEQQQSVKQNDDEITAFDNSGIIQDQKCLLNNKFKKCDITSNDKFIQQQNQSISDMKLCNENDESWKNCSQLISYDNQDVIKEDRTLPWQDVRENKLQLYLTKNLNKDEIHKQNDNQITSIDNSGSILEQNCMFPSLMMIKYQKKNDIQLDFFNKKIIGKDIIKIIFEYLIDNKYEDEKQSNEFFCKTDIKTIIQKRFNTLNDKYSYNYFQTGQQIKNGCISSNEKFKTLQNYSISDMNLCEGNNETWRNCSQLLSSDNQDVIKEDKTLPWQEILQNSRVERGFQSPEEEKNDFIFDCSGFIYEYNIPKYLLNQFDQDKLNIKSPCTLSDEIFNDHQDFSIHDYQFKDEKEVNQFKNYKNLNTKDIGKHLVNYNNFQQIIKDDKCLNWQLKLIEQRKKNPISYDRIQKRRKYLLDQFKNKYNSDWEQNDGFFDDVIKCQQFESLGFVEEGVVQVTKEKAIAACEKYRNQIEQSKKELVSNYLNELNEQQLQIDTLYPKMTKLKEQFENKYKTTLTHPKDTSFVEKTWICERQKELNLVQDNVLYITRQKAYDTQKKYSSDKARELEELVFNYLGSIEFVDNNKIKKKEKIQKQFESKQPLLFLIKNDESEYENYFKNKLNRKIQLIQLARLNVKNSINQKKIQINQKQKLIKDKLLALKENNTSSILSIKELWIMKIDKIDKARNQRIKLIKEYASNKRNNNLNRQKSVGESLCKMLKERIRINQIQISNLTVQFKPSFHIKNQSNIHIEIVNRIKEEKKKKMLLQLEKIIKLRISKNEKVESNRVYIKILKQKQHEDINIFRGERFFNLYYKCKIQESID